ncbi:MAG: PP2C family serine/threonine-protein phosphatase [Xanthobacteraceae bacterium]
MRTDAGLVRKLNEDAVAWITPQDQDVANSRGSLALVADGMGGHAAGEVASALAADVIRRLYYDLDGPVPKVLATAFSAANRAILEYAAEHPDCQGMGTTCTVLAFRDCKAWLAHIGDSRAYLLRDGTLTQLSQDQTLVAKLVSDGTLTQEQADHSPVHNVILQALGTTLQFKPIIGSKGIALEFGDVLILCSDGVFNMVPEGTIADIAGRLPPQEACDALINAALAAGGHDNASLGVFSVKAQAEPTTAREPITRRIKLPLLPGDRIASQIPRPK